MKKPRILISTSNAYSPDLENITGDTAILYSDRATANAILKAGGLPIYMTATSSIEQSDLEAYIDNADGLLLTGADTDTNPVYYGESPTYLEGRIDDERDIVDIALIKRAYQRTLPIMGICKGMQILNVALGGTLYQNIDSQCQNSFDHDIKKTNRANLTHKVTLSNETLLKKIFKQKMIFVNAGHKQAVKKLATKLKIAAVADDGIIEAFEGIKSNFLMGIQFHAELRLFDKSYFSIFQSFIDACRK